MEPTQITPYTKTLHQITEDNSQTNREVNSGQKVSDNNIPFHKNTEENSEGSGAHIRIRYGRIVRKPDRLMY